VKDKFYVGQRVRIKWSAKPERVGMHATVTSGLTWINHHDHGLVLCHCIAIDGIGEWNTNGTVISYLPQNLEPVYDGDQKISWSECVWQPKKETA
jgi:hypothetical protein